MMRKETPKGLSSQFSLDVVVVWERTTGMEVAIMQHYDSVAETEVNRALDYRRAE